VHHRHRRHQALQRLAGLQCWEVLQGCKLLQLHRAPHLGTEGSSLTTEELGGSSPHVSIEGLRTAHGLFKCQGSTTSNTQIQILKHACYNFAHAL